MTNREQWLSFARKQKIFEKRYARRFLAVIREGNKAFADARLDASRLDVLITPLSYRELYLNLYKEAAIPAAKSSYNETRRKAVKFTGLGRDELWISEVVRYIETNGLEMLTQSVSDTHKKILLKLLQQGIDDGLSYEETVRLIINNRVWVANAMRIARTESVRAMNYGHMVGAAALQFETDKVWISARDARTRGADGEDQFDHYHMNEQRVGYNDPFFDARRKEPIMFPGDPHASSGNTINCRCRVIFEPKRDANGRLIPKMPQLPRLSATL
ncbi:Phage head morphogenesis domain containing protein [uncultured Caudovirales phage]|uniref:Phage head morphogenesis domain containing protein n=1 Tax=uncultured Caudovirales phage TaxID=2100421 RepID=A0A6J5M3J1_9CAUD|nr:Phage head morphogenesis domain containing protein [uncultured Caudovirales phage]